jgi:hypothetical protein
LTKAKAKSPQAGGTSNFTLSARRDEGSTQRHSDATLSRNSTYTQEAARVVEEIKLAEEIKTELNTGSAQRALTLLKQATIVG